MVPVSSKLWTKKHGFGRKDMPRSRSTQTVNLKMRQSESVSVIVSAIVNSVDCFD
ncbi:hypothetical protein HanPI659440_Chr02g0092181 [Helianthus annuus]|nr:hypothetical protein HanPI659440_Chr02g0092181 [Helianthus annuus]